MSSPHWKRRNKAGQLAREQLILINLQDAILLALPGISANGEFIGIRAN